MRIDRIDEKLLALLVKRFLLCADIAHAKEKGGLSVEDKARERKLLTQAKKVVGRSDVSGVVLETYRDILKRSKLFQYEVLSIRRSKRLSK
jgi:chorismate mutase